MWPDFGERIEKSTMTEDEKRELKERKARKLQSMVERADMALEGNKRLLDKRQVEKGSWSSDDDKMAFHLRDCKSNLKGSQLTRPRTGYSFSGKTDLTTQ